MIVNNCDLVRIAVLPPKADTPLLIDANTVLPGPITFELLKAIARRRAEIRESLCRIHDDQLSEHGPLQITRIAPNGLAKKEPLRISVTEALDHNGR